MITDYKMTITRELLLPCCGFAANAITQTKKGTQPNPGDVTVCARCLSVLVFDAEGPQRLPAVGEIDSLTPEIVREIEIVRCRIRREATARERGLSS